MSLNCFGAPTKSFRILLASSNTGIKSPTLKPKLIVNDKRNSLNRTREGKVRDYGMRESRERKKIAQMALQTSSPFSLTRQNSALARHTWA